ncbi:MAG: Bug family tripartite tricarboxylate transporter substrate binding protein [Paracoccus sp. (in: a-proteobacteria)]|uniref:Bug family tripartite tricarboxylate transporter substrate binding protein n=4 Tax=Paracoccus TaxID=265 RepID=UPI000C63DD4B|nr:tripartite tricarboxylate transporter substrate binding protein [Paracoccus sp. UBA5162]MAN55250.1 tricarboxylate transport protein TctC [Paracoccus sp. (in: a-proteobacteria)]MCS5601029.1 tripartite tricarboxylate transporter substrate binding protein [Paracoccus sp. (in: a-proteobacteria)]MDB2550956.1 tripartite tricarboxylate transporter substrate binding protein [Paracoccus sp. (in: a-proteobacteria)]HIC66344.1 tripartite tricarboxylate transporter substrate binding protein [Paracoccus s
MTKTLIKFTAVLALTTGLTGTAVLAQDYPAKEIQGIIQWGAGGSTDTVMRTVTPQAEKVLGGKVVMKNMTGGVGAIATKYVYAQKADGYTLLMGAENPLLYKVMGLGDIDYSEFTPINILARGVPILVANNDAPFDTFAEMVEYIQANPNQVKFGSTGPGGVPSVVTALLRSKTELPVTEVPYDGDGPALTALQGGAVDVMPAVLGAAIEGIRGGRMKAISLIDTKPAEALPEVPALGETNPEYADYLPWGPFFGVFVKNGTPEDVVAKLVDAYAKGAESEDFVKLMGDRGYVIESLSGDAATQFLSKWQSLTTWLIADAGLAKKSPEEFGIPRP